MLFAPLEGWRHVKVTDRHTAIDYAQVLKDLADMRICLDNKWLPCLTHPLRRYVSITQFPPSVSPRFVIENPPA
jgi:hypothetical protein